MEKDEKTQSKQKNQLCIDIKNFKIIKLIQKGGFGSVFSVQDIKSKLLYAAKVINYNNDEAKYKTMINREIEIMIRVQHPTIIKFYGYSLKDFNSLPNVVIFMELAQRGSLSKLLENSRSDSPDKNFDNTARQIILIGVARGMMHLHQHQIIHRDLKPGNVLIDENYQPHISDFGLSKFYEADSINQSRTCGTAIYKAPEVITSRQYTEKSDVYSLSILMYEVLTGLIPYPEFISGELTEYKFNEDVVRENLRPTFSSPIKKSLRKLIEICWSKNPSERPTFEEIFNMLAFNIDYKNYEVFEKNKEKVEDEEEFKYYLDGIDVNKVISYVDIITKNDSNVYNNTSNIIIDELQKEIEKIKKHLSLFQKNISIEFFNSLPLELQQPIISEIIKNSSIELKNQRFVNFNNILLYLINLVKSSNNYNYVKIPIKSIDEGNCFIREGFMYLNRIYLLSDATEILYRTKALNSNDFINLLQKFDDIFIELKYPSKCFKSCYKMILNVKSSCNIKIAIYISDINEIDTNFKYDSRICSVKTDSSVTAICDYAFDGCLCLSSISLSNSLVSIGIASFHKCSSLTEITIPSSVTSISSHAFRECSSLNKIVIPSSVESINEYAFSECSSLIEITIPPLITSIKDYAFNGCTSLNKISLPSSLKSIDEGVFFCCASLEYLKIPDSVVSIGIHAFEKCSALRQLIIPSSITSIGASAFCECTSLSQVLIISSITSICEFTFLGCSSLSQIMIPSSVNSIEKCAFSGCNSLTLLLIPPSVKSIGPHAFELCSSLVQISIPSSVTFIGEDAFIGCASLQQIAIPSSIEVIDNLGISDVKKIVKY